MSGVTCITSAIDILILCDLLKKSSLNEESGTRIYVHIWCCLHYIQIFNDLELPLFIHAVGPYLIFQVFVTSSKRGSDGMVRRFAVLSFKIGSHRTAQKWKNQLFHAGVVQILLPKSSVRYDDVRE